MPAAASKSFATPDDLRTPPKATVAVVDLNGSAVARLTFEPGWRWSESMKPVAGTDTCQARHLGALASGTLHVLAADGTHMEVGPGSAYTIEPGHDAWVVGDEPVVAYEFVSPG
ncbi:MAG TPA: cupin domain-containing protein [Rugosimonospora sp.]|nr:cupin domain-containing protein [Rugosimonospora sp.]